MKRIFHFRKVLIAMAIILIAGILLGIIVGWASRDYCHHRKSAGFRQRILKKFTSRLKLTKEQQQQFEPLLDIWTERYHDTRGRHVESILRNLEIQRQEIRPLLNSEQDRELDRLYLETIERIKQKLR